MTLPVASDGEQTPPEDLPDIDIESGDLDGTIEPAIGTGADPRKLGTSADDAQLAVWIDRIVERDQRSLMALYDATLVRVYGLVLRMVRRAHLAEEVTEEVYFQVWRQAPRFDADRGRPLTWLLGMARSRAIDAMRRESRFHHEALDEDAYEAFASRTESGDELLAVAQSHAELHRALLVLKPQARQLLALAFFNGLTHEEISVQTCVPLGTVKSQIRRALSVLRETLAPASAKCG